MDTENDNFHIPENEDATPEQIKEANEPPPPFKNGIKQPFVLVKGVEYMKPGLVYVKLDGLDIGTKNTDPI